MGHKKDDEKENVRKQQQREAYEKHRDQIEIGKGRMISTPEGQSRTTRDLHESQKRERDNELEKIKKLGVVSETLGADKGKKKKKKI